MASARHEAFLTMDRRLPEEQRLDDLPFAVLLVVAPTNRMADLGPLVPRILEALDSPEAGKVTVVAAYQAIAADRISCVVPVVAPLVCHRAGPAAEFRSVSERSAKEGV